MSFRLDRFGCVLDLAGRDSGIDARLKDLIGRHDCSGSDMVPSGTIVWSITIAPMPMITSLPITHP